MKKGIAFLLLLFFCASSALAGIYIYGPKDKLTTFKDIEVLSGVARDISVLKVNGQLIEINDKDTFTCGLVLGRGKNLVEVRALDNNGKQEVKELRILALKTFPDIEALYEGQKHWARNPIVYLSTLGFIEGYPDDNFYPGNPITRGEFATWLARTKKLRIPTLTDDVFFDVPKEHWRAPFVKAVIDAGYMKGYDELTFGLDDPISRRRAAQIVLSTEGIGVVEKVKPLFIDVPKAERGAFPIYIAKEKGLVRGVSSDLPVYEPERALTRAEAAVLLSRFNRSQNAIQYLFNFAKGFSNAFCKLNVEPKVLSFSITPDSIKAKEKSTIHLQAQISPRQGFSSISKVTVDLLELGGAPDVKLYDDGTHGDQVKEDGYYALNLSLQPETSGSKTIRVKAVDRFGWSGENEARLLVVE
jgi:S-layer homology domain/Glucodextranase, domain B